jgi:hypothetical protein
MNYFKINGNDYSMYVNKLSVARQHNATSRESATGMLLVKRKSTVRLLEVGIIPLDSTVMVRFMNDINKPNVKVSFLDPLTNTLVENMPCIIATNLVEYYTINAANGTKFRAFTISIQEVKEAA